ncbi:unnamed protein product [Macrosiphum euphorbiae]|uniref:Uncharacterized protein n=1 Tax=Macrosiphum euphorbiae TaxID=13131 RepID=A0AAV0XCP3_9HEMI|nr:unnamed protein product [Macrosiphum euphorbiae]
MLLTPAETAETKIQAPSATTAKSKSLPAELNVAVPVTCVDMQGTADAAIKDQVVITNTEVKPRSRPLIVSSTISLNDMDLAKSRASCYGSYAQVD